jgi:predicted porin
METVAMKKSLLVLAIASLAAGTAAAQSSVTLFGIADLSARGVKNGSAGSQKQLASGGLATSRLGFRGVEDLGGGLFARFHLEAAVNPDVGTTDTAKFFGRRSTVSLESRFGELRLGRDYNPTAMNTFDEPFGLVGVGTVGNFTYAASAALGSGATTVLRNDNSIAYFLPSNLGGLYGSAMVAAGEGVAGNKGSGGRIGYSAGPFDVAVGFFKTETASNTDYDQANLKAIYKFGFASLNFLYDTKKFGSIKQKMAMIGTNIPFGQSEIRVAYATNNRSGGAVGSGFANEDDSKLMALGYVYNLSKRTAMYATAARITNDGAARASVSNAPPAGMLGGETSTGYEFGVMHRF